MPIKRNVSQNFINDAPQQVTSKKLDRKKDRVTVTVQFPTNLYTYLKDLKRLKGINTSPLLRELVEEYMKKNPITLYTPFDPEEPLNGME